MVAGGTGITADMEKGLRRQERNTGFRSCKQIRNGTKGIDALYKDRDGKFLQFGNAKRTTLKK